MGCGPSHAAHNLENFQHVSPRLFYIGFISASPTACPLRRYGRGSTQNDCLSEAVILSAGTPIPAQWTCRRRCRYRADKEPLCCRACVGVRLRTHARTRTHACAHTHACSHARTCSAGSPVRRRPTSASIAPAWAITIYRGHYGGGRRAPRSRRPGPHHAMARDAKHRTSQHAAELTPRRKSPSIVHRILRYSIHRIAHRIVHRAAHRTIHRLRHHTTHRTTHRQPRCSPR